MAEESVTREAPPEPAAASAEPKRRWHGRKIIIDDERCITLHRCLDDVPDSHGRNSLSFYRNGVRTAVGLSDEAVEALTTLLNEWTPDEIGRAWVPVNAAAGSGGEPPTAGASASKAP